MEIGNNMSCCLFGCEDICEDISNSKIKMTLGFGCQMGDSMLTYRSFSFWGYKLNGDNNVWTDIDR